MAEVCAEAARRSFMPNRFGKSGQFQVEGLAKLVQSGARSKAKSCWSEARHEHPQHFYCVEANDTTFSLPLPPTLSHSLDLTLDLSP